MNSEECIKSRRSVRNFTQEKVSKELIESIIDSCRYAPTWKNAQIARYTVIEDKKVLEQITSECVLGFTYNANTINNCSALVVLSYVTGLSGFEKDGSYSTSKEDRWEMFDAGIATQTFCLAAWDKGIGSVILGIFDDAKVAKAISLPSNQKVAALIPIGYPVNTPEAPRRKETNELLTFI